MSALIMMITEDFSLATTAEIIFKLGEYMSHHQPQRMIISKREGSWLSHFHTSTHISKDSIIGSHALEWREDHRVLTPERNKYVYNRDS